MVDIDKALMERQRKGVNWKKIAVYLGIIIGSTYLGRLAGFLASIYLVVGHVIYRKMYSGFQVNMYLATTLFWLPLMIVDLVTGDTD